MNNCPFLNCATIGLRSRPTRQKGAPNRLRRVCHAFSPPSLAFSPALMQSFASLPPAAPPPLAAAALVVAPLAQPYELSRWHNTRAHACACHARQPRMCSSLRVCFAATPAPSLATPLAALAASPPAAASASPRCGISCRDGNSARV